MSPRAACRLEGLGFTQVHDYVPGKVDWLAHNLPIEGTAADAPTIGRHLGHDVITVAPDEPLAHLIPRITASRYGFALVLAADKTVLGRLRASTVSGTDPVCQAGDVMEAGPTTLRPHQPVAQIHAGLLERNLSYAIVTDPEGHLLGTVHLADLG